LCNPGTIFMFYFSKTVIFLKTWFWRKFVWRDADERLTVRRRGDMVHGVGERESGSLKLEKKLSFLLNWSFEGLDHWILEFVESREWIFQQRNFVDIIIKLLWLLQDVLETGNRSTWSVSVFLELNGCFWGSGGALFG